MDDKKTPTQLTLFPELDLKSKEPLQVNPTTNEIYNKFVERPVRKPGAVPPKTNTIKKFKQGGTTNNTNKRIPRKETMDERIVRSVYQYDNPKGMPEPKHMKDPYIVKDENWGQRPIPFDNNNPDSFPSDVDQKQKLSSWDLIFTTAKTKEEKADVRRILNDAYSSNPKTLTEKELKFIGKHPSQQIKLTETKPIKVPDPIFIKPEPEIPLEQIIKERADERLKKEQEVWDKQFGNVGIVKLLRPE